MKKLFVLFAVMLIVLFSFNISAQVDLKKSQPTFEKGKIAIKLKEGIGPFSKQTGNVSFAISSIDQKAIKFEVFSLSEMFIHKSIPKNSNLPDLSRIYQIEFPEKYNPLIVARDFNTDPNIEYAEPIPINYLLEVPNDPLYSQQWYLNKIQSEYAWDIHKGQDGDSVVILSISDTGLRYMHPDIGQNIWNNLGEDADGDGKTFEWNGSTWVFDADDINNIDNDQNGFIDDLIGWNFDNNSRIPIDGNGHGTAVAGIAGATTNNSIGVASISYNLKIMPVRAFNENGSGSNLNEYNSLIYSAENGADVINCSWGGEEYSQANKEVIEYVYGLGSIIVAAAGNNNNAAPFYPACYPYVVSVAAVDSQDARTFYSNYGSGIDVSAPGPQESQPFIALSTGDGYTNATHGTSFSSPIVTGLTGLIKSYHPDWTNDQILKQLFYTADDINNSNPGFEHQLGTGKVNAFHSLLDSIVNIEPELKFNLTLLDGGFLDNSKIMSPNAVVDFSIRVQNCSHFIDANPLTITLTSDNADIQIIDGNYSGFLNANSIVELPNEFQIQVTPTATTALATISFNISANYPVVIGDVFEFKIIVNPSGTLVWEGDADGQNYSGEFIKNYLETHSYPFLYTEIPVLSYQGLDAVFLSFGNFGSGYTVFDDYHAMMVENYLQSGGSVYLEGADALGFDQASNTILLNLLGINTAVDGTTNPINGLQGLTNGITIGMLFNSSTQTSFDYIDKYTPYLNGIVGFYESLYGFVGLQNAGSYGQKSFSFSYSLSNLVDGTMPSTRENLLQKIIDYFELVVLPVELTSFNAEALDQKVILKWTTATELNNNGFEIQRRVAESDFATVGFVKGEGTTTNQKEYSYIDKDLIDGKYFYRLKQVDYNGSYEYSDVIEVDVRSLNEYALEQNFPNPFNPTTTIGYVLREKSNAKLILLNAIGEEVVVLVNEEQDKGFHKIDFNASTLASGVYFYRLQAGSFVETKKMVLLK